MDLKKRGFQLPEKMRFEEDTLTDTYGKLIAEPLERGYATTLGNSLRRVLLSSIEGAAVTGVKIEGALHEFTTLEGIKEDAVDVILNIKSLELQMDSSGTKTARIQVTGPKTVTGADLQLDPSVNILNPDHLIVTVDKGATFEAELYVSKGKGYVPSEINKERHDSVYVLAVDSIFNPIRKVNYTVEKSRVGRSADYDKLVLEVWTNGAITPEAAISQASLMLIEHLNYFVSDKEEEAGEPEHMTAKAIDEASLNKNLLKNVDELELSVRAHNCLKNANIKTISDLVQRTEHDMLRTKNFGRKSLLEIKEILLSMGLNFGMRIEPEALQKLKDKASGG